MLHNYPDDKCLVILKNLIQAMDKDSLILIDGMVLPNSGVHWQAIQADLTVIAAFGSRERTREQWDALIDRAGLKILSIHSMYITPRFDYCGCTKMDMKHWQWRVANDVTYRINWDIRKYLTQDSTAVQAIILFYIFLGNMLPTELIAI